MPKSPYCLMPFIHFHVGNKGVAQACCVANIPYGNINKKSVEEIWQGKPINDLRAKFLRGETDKRCAVCHKLEATGGKSIRLETFEKFPNVIVSPTPESPIYFDIRFSNVCNFRCRTCWHGASSKWFKDAKMLGRNVGNSAIIANIKDFELFIKKNGAALLEAEEFYFAGGEPLVTEEHYLLLEWLIKNGATQARLRYNTNFSVLKFKQYAALELWKHFPKVELLASIDASEELGEYIRKDMNWNTILENREKIHALPHVAFKIAPTVSVLNVAELPNLYQKSIALQLIESTDMYINILERPDYYNIQILPEARKEQVAELFLQTMTTETPISIRRAFQEILDYMFAKDRSNLWTKLLQETKLLDELRHENLPNIEA